MKYFVFGIFAPLCFYWIKLVFFFSSVVLTLVAYISSLQCSFLSAWVATSTIPSSQLVFFNAACIVRIESFSVHFFMRTLLKNVRQVVVQLNNSRLKSSCWWNFSQGIKTALPWAAQFVIIERQNLPSSEPIGMLFSGI